MFAGRGRAALRPRPPGRRQVPKALLSSFDRRSFASIDKPSPNGSLGGWLSAADIRGIGTAGGSGSIGTKVVSVVPEPSTVVLAAMGGLGLIGLRLRRRGRATA